jgi:predicted RNA-binding protein with PIN domain
VALHIIIDGYNVIGSEQGLRGDLDAKRSALLHELKGYQARKDHSITVVFDGWRAGRLQQIEQHIGKIQILFSRYGEKADTVIQRMARQMGAGCTVVTSDRELRRSVEAAGAVAIYVQEFLGRLRRTHAQEPNDEPDNFETADMPVQRGRKKGNPRKLSKIERLRRERLKKL